MVNPKILVLVNIVFAIFIQSCEEEEKVLPRPIGQMRVEFPEHEYKSAEIIDCPFSFDIPIQSEITRGLNPQAPCHKTILFNDFNAALYLSYYELDSIDVNTLIKESRDKVYEHVVKASAIDEELLIDSVNHKYGIFYDIKGNAATPFQFFLTDSSSNFIRGSLMFNSQANYDSLRPMIQYLRTDVDKMIETTLWKTK